MIDTNFKITPDIGVLNAFKNFNYKSWYALAEYIDNSLQSFLTKNGKYGEIRNICRININYDSQRGYLSIEDNAFGISESEHARAFTAGIPPSDNAGLSEFGMGMKSASFWFCPTWKVATQPIDSDFDYQYKIDVKDVIKNDGLISSLVNESQTKKGYTKIELFNTFRKLGPSTQTKIKKHLSSIYRCYLNTNQLEIFFNDEKLIFNSPEILNAPAAYADGDPKTEIKWEKKISFSTSNGGKVTGFVGIRKNGSYPQAGLSLFRRNRLIMGSDEEKYKPKSIFAGSNSFRSLRVFGELHLEGYQVTFSKDNFDFRDDEEEEFLDKLKEEMNSYPLPILLQADKYREKVNKETKSNFQKLTNKAFEDVKLTQKIEELNIAVAEQTKVQGGIEKIFPNLGKNKIDKFEGIEIKKDYLNVSKEVNQNSIKIAGTTFNISYNLNSFESSDLYKIEFLDELSKRPEAKIVNLLINIRETHPLISQFCNTNKEALHVLTSIIVTQSITEILLRSNGQRYVGLYKKCFNEIIETIDKTMRD
tara:strand:- start:5697 stop:7298 length:1602 start_codon:yes stop_codon:yes gene_type:complete